jgi:hypothetical protein
MATGVRLRGLVGVLGWLGSIGHSGGDGFVVVLVRAGLF